MPAHILVLPPCAPLNPRPQPQPHPPAVAVQGEQEEYAREGIAWSYIDFVDNQDCLDL